MKKTIEFEDSLNITKCLKQIEISDLLNICAPCSELPFNISTMLKPKDTNYMLVVNRDLPTNHLMKGIRPDTKYLVWYVSVRPDI